MRKNIKQKNKGSVVVMLALYFVAASVIIISGLSFTAFKDLRNIRSLYNGKVSYYVSEASFEDTIYRLKNAISVSNNTMAIDGRTAYTTVTDTYDGYTTILSVASTSDYYRKIQAVVTLATDVSFHYGIQSGNGGFTLANQSSIIGNVYSDGSVVGAGNYIYGDVISTGASGLVYGIHATSSVYAHKIGDASRTTTIDGSAYYQTLTNTTVTGAQHSGSTDQATTTLPIPDSLIAKWETDAATGGTMSSSSCDTYDVSSRLCTFSSSKNLGPIKIPFNVKFKSNSAVITVNGPIWVTGNVYTETGSTIRMGTSLQNNNVAIIADDTTNRATSSTVTIGQTGSFLNNGYAGNYVFMVSQNNSAETGGSTAAISMQQGSSALVVYAGHGLISITQSSQILAAAAYKIALENSADVTYDTGLASLLFTTGSGASYGMVSWNEI